MTRVVHAAEWLATSIGIPVSDAEYDLGAVREGGLSSDLSSDHLILRGLLAAPAA